DAVEDEVVSVVKEDHGNHVTGDGIQSNAAHTEQHHDDGEPKGDSLIEKVVAAPGDAPGLIERHFKGKKDAGAGDQNHDQGEDLHAMARCGVSKIFGDKALI